MNEITKKITSSRDLNCSDPRIASKTPCGNRNGFGDWLTVELTNGFTVATDEDGSPILPEGNLSWHLGVGPRATEFFKGTDRIYPATVTGKFRDIQKWFNQGLIVKNTNNG